MKAILSLTFVGVLLFSATTPSEANNRRRQYYSSWSYSNYGYYYRTYYYQPAPTYTTYHYHYVVYYPSRPYYYYYNPYSQAYWGRVPVNHNGKDVYSLLSQEHRKGTLGEIKEEHFPKPASMPTLPESKDGTKMDIPPSDLPTSDLPRG
jgi:hypothetical protein